jgi:hypothetical protein
LLAFVLGDLNTGKSNAPSPILRSNKLGRYFSEKLNNHNAFRLTQYSCLGEVSSDSNWADNLLHI